MRNGHKIDKMHLLSYTGRFSVHISQLQAPPDNLMCRPINQPWVREIKEELIHDDTATVTVLPCLIDPDCLRSQTFSRCSIQQYTFLTLGGNHTRTAAQV